MAAYLTVLVSYLVAQSWQIAVLTVVVAIATFALRRRSAHVRHLLWLIILAKCLVPPLYAVPMRVLPPTEHEATLSAVSPPATRLEDDAVIASAQPGVLGPVQRGLPSSTADNSEPRQPESVAVVPGPAGWIAGAFWLAGAAGYLAANLLRALRGHFWLRKSRQPLPEAAQAEREALLRAYGVRRLPKIWIIEGVSQPFVWGLLRGSIYVPPGFLTIAGSAHRRAILAHELSHVYRLDAAVNTLQVIAQGLFWFHPLVWWANRRIRQEREKCCDEMVVARLHTTPKDYSTAIVETLAHATESAGPVPSLAVAGSAKNIRERITTMLRPEKRFYGHPSATVAAAIALVGLLTVPTTLMLTARAGASDESDSVAVNEIPEHYPLPQGWRLEYDDGLRPGGGQAWPSQVARDLASLEIAPTGLDMSDMSWKNERYEFGICSPGNKRLGTVQIHFDRPEMQRGRMTLRPGQYTLRYTRRFGDSADNVRLHSGPFSVDLPEPGMYKLHFTPKLGSAEITGSLGGCYALNFERTDDGFSVTGFVYQHPAKQYTINGLPAGTYRFSGVTQHDGPNVFVRQAQAIVKTDGKVTVDIAPPSQGDCSLHGVIAGRRGTYWAPTPAPTTTDPRWFVLIRTRGSGPVEETTAYEAQTMDSHYVVRKPRIVQEADDRASYTISGIAPGEYTVTVIEHPWFEGVPIERQQSKPLTLRSGETAVLDFDLRDPAVLRYDSAGLRPTTVNSELPPLDQIGHAAEIERTEGKRLLVCLFDMDQRPSRNCLLELNRRAESLFKHGIVVLGVQATETEADTLTEWAKQKGIGFPMGRIAAPEDRIRFAWGAKALPWLILTDDQHVVVAQSGALGACRSIQAEKL